MDTKYTFQNKLSKLLSDIAYPQELRSIERMAGDASSRQYFRLHFEHQPSLVLMQWVPGGAFLSEEKEGHSNNIKEIPFLNTCRYFKKAGLPVPDIMAFSEDDGLILLEDLGDELLEDHVELTHYHQALDILVQMQVEGTRQLDEQCVAYYKNFDKNVWLWEFEHFIEYGLELGGERKVAAADKQALIDVFQQLSQHFADLPNQLCHRDFHSRNLMLKNGKLRLIDFQDALMAPPHYDLASLLKDAYTQLSEEHVQDLINYYINAYNQRTGKNIDAHAFAKDTMLIAFQRNLKAWGRFEYLDRVKHKALYKKYIPNLKNNVAHMLNHLEELKPIQAIMIKYAPELDQ